MNLLVDSHGFLEYVDAVLLDERSSLNNQYVFQFLYVFFPKVTTALSPFPSLRTLLNSVYRQVADQVLTDQVKRLIHGMCKNLIEIAGTYDLTRPNAVKHLNGDMRALLLVHSGVSDIATVDLKAAVLILKDRVVKQASLMESEVQSSEDNSEKQVMLESN